ncbi:LysR substrate-binding domain-containing protein [Steroidobacter sp.]|uniref:LysR substrate-binding domain-containing protein n=1 Tax=Steroidobacter sp. TaxID=1978227 RepID=UPI001A54D6FA|nr:LysR substrate-binding domain-containing protein [Steroidobacter sp.]MBL8271289.1 LysR family transcriptional regulator [Steroidobacter sp.]
MMAEERLRLELPALQLPSRKSLPPFEALRAFDAIARLGGVRRAAEYLCRDHGVVSRHLRTIEDWTGTKLVRRTATGAVLTPHGARYHRMIASAIDAIANATVDLMGGGDDRRLCIRCMPGLALLWLSSRLASFSQAHTDFEIEVRPIDHATGMPTEHGDVQLRLVASYGLHAQLPPEYRSLDFAHSPIIAVASPHYIESHATIEKPSDLLQHHLLHEENYSGWYTWLAAHGVNSETEFGGLKLWQGHLTLDAARHDGGIALTNHLTAARDLASGRLVEIGKDLPSFASPAMGIWRFIARTDGWDTTAVRQFRAWLITTVQREHPQLMPAKR